jgi:hypothetical protein
MPVPSSQQTVEHNGGTFLVEERTSFLTHLEAAKAAAGQRGVAEGMVAHVVGVPAVQTAPPVTYSLAQYQTAFRNQGDRGTCWAFAGAAAMEAMYKRKYGVTLDIAEQYVFHVAKVQELAYNPMDPLRSHENNSTLWGFQGASDIVTKFVRSALCEEQYAPYLFQSTNIPSSNPRPTMTQIQNGVPSGNTITAANANPAQSTMDAFEFLEAVVPSAARAQCRYKATGTGDPGKYDSTTLYNLIATGVEVVVDITLDYKADANGVWQYDATVSGGGHVVLLIGYDVRQQYFLAKNSWGDTSFTKIGFGFIDKCCGWAHYITGVTDPKAAVDKRAFWMGTWNMDYDGWRGTLEFRRHTDYRASDDTKPTRLGTYVRDNIAYDVNGQFDSGYQHCIFYIAPSNARVTPGSEVGQRFDMYCFSYDVGHAAGKTTWNNGSYGAMMSRPALPAQTPATFQMADWIGTYTMNHDGWMGTLTVNSVAPLTVSYKDSNGQYTVHGTVNQHEMAIVIAFPGNNQPFDLLYHTWEKGVISGTTTWGGQTFGAYALLNK